MIKIFFGIERNKKNIYIDKEHLKYIFSGNYYLVNDYVIGIKSSILNFKEINCQVVNFKKSNFLSDYHKLVLNTN